MTDDLFHSGKLKIAEVKSRFTDVQAFIDMICSIGFTLISKVYICTRPRQMNHAQSWCTGRFEYTFHPV